MDNSLLGLLASLMLGLFAFMNVPGLQLYVVELAEKYVPEDITLASAFNIAAFNIGITVGSMTGGGHRSFISNIYTDFWWFYRANCCLVRTLYSEARRTKTTIFRKLKAAGHYGTDQLLLSFCGNNSSKQLKQLLIRLTRKSEK